MDIEEALEVIRDLTRFGINLGLQRITNLLAHFDNPQDKLPVIHIGGTNGKGSTTAVLAAILKEAGYRVGTYTSPHLVSYTERIVFDNTPVAEREFSKLLGEIKPVFEEVKEVVGEYPTEFEVLTAMAFLYFYRRQADIVLLEVGLGGDIDSTNVVRTPLLSIITNVSIEHTDYLGNTLEEIVKKKSGIMKRNCPVITASSDKRALEILRREAEKKEAPFHEVFREMSWDIKKETLEGQVFHIKSDRQDYGELFVPLQGEHQLVNTATALLALEKLAYPEWNISKEKIKKGVAALRWPGRLEIIDRKPLIVIDGAHNPAGMEALSCWLGKQRPVFRRIILVIGMLADKDRRGAVRHIEGLVDRVVITRVPSLRAGNWQEIQKYFRHKGKEKEIIENLPEALDAALYEAGSEDMIVVTGSLYLIGEARRILLAR